MLSEESKKLLMAKNDREKGVTMNKKIYPLIFKELPCGTKIKKKNSVKL